MRVTDSYMILRFNQRLNQITTAGNKLLGELSDGKRVRYGSDDPLDAGNALQARARLIRTRGYERAAESARSDLTGLDAFLSESLNTLTRARSLALAGGSDTTDADILADDLESLRTDLLSLANRRQSGRYLLSGTEATTQPFDAAGVYQGDGDETRVEIADGLEVQTTLDGRKAFDDSAGNTFATLENLVTALRVDDDAAVQTAIGELDAQIDQLISARSEVGVRLSTVSTTLLRNSDEQLRLEQRISEVEDVALEKVIVDLGSNGNAYEALTAAGAQFLNRSLFDVLR